MARLDYEPTAAARPVVVEHDGGLTRVVVPTEGLWVPVPHWTKGLDLLSLIVVPLWWLGTLMLRLCLRLPNPPRAIFEVTEEHIAMTLRDPGSGEATTLRWPRSAVVEARADRFEPGLWIDVSGHVKETYLTARPRPILTLGTFTMSAYRSDVPLLRRIAHRLSTNTMKSTKAPAIATTAHGLHLVYIEETGFIDGRVACIERRCSSSACRSLKLFVARSLSPNSETAFRTCQSPLESVTTTMFSSTRPTVVTASTSTTPPAGSDTSP